MACLWRDSWRYGCSEEREFASERRFDIPEIDMSRYLSPLGETVNLFEACTSDATFEDAIILLCVYIKRFIVDRWLRLRCMGRGGWILGERGLGFIARWGGGGGGSRRVVIC
jgi:hypothetical protein